MGNEIEPEYREQVKTREQLLLALGILDRVDWFLKWLGNTCPDTFPYIAQEWLRSDPICNGIRYRKLSSSVRGENFRVLLER
jgi:hypothetical protein